MLKEPAQVNSRRKYTYGAFISYSHRSDGTFATALQQVIERLAKPWYRRRAIDLFRDDTDLAANPDLWPRIVAALNRSEHLLLLGSPAAAQSQWVSKEVDYWKSNYDVTRIVVALTEGAIVWDEAKCDFDWQQTTAIPPILAGAFKSEPLWADFRNAKSGNKDAAAFRHPAINLAAGLRGIAPRDLESEDLRQHRRTIRFAVVGLITLFMLTIGAVLATIQALHERDLAKSRELAALSQAALAADPELGVLLAMRAEKLLPTPQGEQALRLALPLSYLKSAFQSDGDSFNALAFNSDGTRIVTSSGSSYLGKKSDCKARVWNTATGQVLAILSGPQPMSKSSFSPDGHLVLTVASGSGAWLWAAETAKVVIDLRAHDAAVNAASFSPDGRHVVTGTARGATFVWSTTPGTEPLELKEADSVNDVSFSPDGQSILTATGKGKLLDSLTLGLFMNWRSRFMAGIWDVRSGVERLRIQGFAAPISIARFSPDGKHIVTVTSQSVAVLLDAKDGRRIAELQGHTAPITALAFSADGRYLATASDDTTARVWDAWTGAQRADLRRHQQPLSSVAISRDGKIVVTAGADPYAVVWDAETGKPLGELRGHTSEITALQLSPDEHSIATTSRDGTMRLWRIPTAAPTDPMGPVGSVVRMGLSSDGERILVENAEGQLSVWARRTATRLAKFGPAPFSARPAWSADGSRVVVRADSYRAIVYDAGTGAVIKQLGEQEPSLDVVALSPDGRRFAASERQDQDLKIAIWDVASGRVVLRAPIDITLDAAGLQFSPDGTRLLMTKFSSAGSELRDAATGALLAKFSSDIIRPSRSGQLLLELYGRHCLAKLYDAHTGMKRATLAFPDTCFRLSDGAISDDDRRVVILEAGLGKVAIWDIAEQRLASEFAADVPLLNAGLALSPDGHLMALKGPRYVEIWDLRKQKKVRNLEASAEDLMLAFTPDGKALVIAGKDGTARVYPAEALLPIEDLIREAQSSVTRDLSESEVRELSQH